MVTKKHMLGRISTLLALLFFYAALSKLLDYEKSRHDMLNQVLPRLIKPVLVWLVPVMELVLVAGLLLQATRLKALYASAALLVLFSLYIAFGLSGLGGRVPCSCGGILKHMGYWTHLWFNLFFIVMAVLGIALEKQWNPIHRWFYFLKKKGGQSKLNE